MTPDQVISRARSQIGQGTIYALGKGGMLAGQERAANTHGQCDCSGFVAWCLGVSRQTSNPWYRSINGGWFETTAVFKDCGTPFGFVDGVPWSQAQLGMLVVWGDHDGHQGHIGVVSEVDSAGPAKVIHCSSGNYKALGDAVAETDSGVFKHNDALVARVAWVKHEGIA